MKKSILYITAAALLLAPACQRELDIEGARPQGDVLIAQIVDGTVTRTSYDGTYSDNNFKWTEGDQIAIHYTTGKYDFVTLTPFDGGKKGRFVCSTKTGVVRDAYAVYPIEARDEDHYGATKTDLYIKYADEYDITGKLVSDYTSVPMVADNTTVASTADDVDLNFYHVGGLLRITMTELDASTQKIKVTLDKDITGTFKVSFDSDGIPSVSTSAKTTKNVVTFKLAEISVGAGVSKVVLNVPVPCATYEQVVVDMLNASGTVLSTKTFNRSMTFDRHHGKQLGLQEVVLSYNGNEVEDIVRSGDAVLDDYTKNVTISVSKTDGTTTSPSSWKAYFSSTAVEPGTTINPAMVTGWSDTPLKDSEGKAWLTLSAYEGDGNANTVTVDVAAAILPTTRIPGTSAAEMINYWQNTATPVEFRDLSTYDILTCSESESIQTANCYVIDTYGTFLIPCVYGNGIQGSVGQNTTFYTTATGDENHPFLSAFVNADGLPIKNAIVPRDPNLTMSDNLIARVVWQDTYPGCEILSDNDLKYVKTNGTAANCPYIIADFKKEKMAPGNIVVALYDVNNAKILWSWHLWVTSTRIKTTAVLEADDASTVHVMNMNLGWTPPVSYQHHPTLAREQHVVIVSLANEKVMDCFKVSQASHTETVKDAEILDGVAYSNTYYQYGRKDPMPPGTGRFEEATGFNKPVSYGEGFDGKGDGPSTIATMSFDSGVSATERLAQMIKNPYKFFLWHNEEPWYMNLWNISHNQYFDPSSSSPFSFDDSVAKTVYDPSPRGFKVPNLFAFSGFTETGLNFWDDTEGTTRFARYVDASGERPAGYYMSDNHSSSFTDNDDLFFPMPGYRFPYVGSSSSPYAGHVPSEVSYPAMGYYLSAEARYNPESSTPFSTIHALVFNKSKISPINSGDRSDGRCLRPIAE